jgi:hypothetical protein
LDVVSAEELLIEEGKSGELIAVFQAVQETTINDLPKFSRKTCHELARSIACRSYGTALVELCYMLVAASACDRIGGRFESFFWDSGAARASAFRAYLQAAEPLPDGIAADGAGVTVVTGDDTFTVTYGRMPFLSAMVEFLMTALGYEVLDEQVRPLLGGVPSRASITETANAISRQLYDYLKDHLPTAHTQRKTHELLDFLGARGTGSGPDLVDDPGILEFWLGYSAEADERGDFKTYQGVFEAAVQLRRVLQYAFERYQMTGARSIGADREAGEIDPAAIEEAVAAMEEAVEPLQRLAESPLDEIKFLNGREAGLAGDVALGPGVAPALAHSVLRNAVFGKAQNRITNALRHGGLDDGLIDGAPEADYNRQLKSYGDLLGRVETTLLAVFYGLAHGRRAETIDLVLALRPDIDLAGLKDSDEPEWEDDNVVLLHATSAVDRFFDGLAETGRKTGPLGKLMGEARKAFRGNARQGFSEDDLGDDDILDGYVDGASALLALHKELSDFVDGAGRIDWPDHFDRDTSIFHQHFRILYGGADG